jgi:ABC-type cobalamin/Fe3+-siderophores transport system ATPase subunit
MARHTIILMANHRIDRQLEGTDGLILMQQGRIVDHRVTAEVLLEYGSIDAYYMKVIPQPLL